MTRYIIRRVLQIILTLLVYQTLIFFLIQAQPGDASNIYIHDTDIPPAVREQMRRDMGLDKPPLQQYANYLRNFVTGNLGVSFIHYPRPVIDIIKERAPRTLVLFGSATLVSFWLGFVMGKMLAWRRGSFIEYASTVGGVTLYTVFMPWFGLLMTWLFAFKLDLFPIGKFLSPPLWRNAPVAANVVFGRMLLSAGLLLAVLFVLALLARRLDLRQRIPVWAGGGAFGLLGGVAYWLASGHAIYALDIVHHLALPVLTLTLISFAGTMLLTRTSMLETLREDYILTARAKGLPEKVIRDRHAARNALLPVVTSLVFSLAFAIDGGVITESIFSWPGMGMTLLKASLTEDIPLALGALSFTAILALTAHLVADILYAALDPRIRYQ